MLIWLLLKPFQLYDESLLMTKLLAHLKLISLKLIFTFFSVFVCDSSTNRFCIYSLLNSNGVSLEHKRGLQY